ncbi:MAG TPA: hypothetical protein VK540_28230 [Polyangiaceae bacterium]|jgi:hypothetical protein|nr:hypothetical protein [Polyangiaceae bacterium]
MPNLRSILFFAMIWAFATGCSSDKTPPFVGDNPNTKPDASTQTPDATDDGMDETGMGADTGTPGLCTDAGNCAVILTAATTTLPADGKAQDVITASVDARVGGTIDFSITGPGLWDNNKTAITVLVDAFGKARANFVSDASGGTATITARLVGRDSAAQINIEMPALADITYSTQHNLMGVKSSGFNESNQITFKILAPNGVPYPDGLTVNFEHKPLSGSTIGNQPTCSMLDCTVKDVGVTEKGQVQLSLSSGTLQGAAIVTITATAGGQTKRIDVSSPIVGAKVSGRNVSIECTPRNVPAFVDTDCIRSRVDTPFKCTVTLGDRFNNEVGVSTTVKYQSEAGIVGPPPTTPMFPSPDLGKATGTVGTVGGVLPLDVFPMPGEYSYAFADACHPSGPTPVHNPRDGIVSVIAMMTGEEGFIDKNGDGTYNQGEPFIDLPEPFVDANDNGVQDSGEFFQDLNQDLRWNAANGSWDASTTLWTETRIVYTGNAFWYEDTGGNQYFSRFFPITQEFPPSIEFPMHATPFVPRVLLPPDSTADFGLWFSDWNFNVLASTVKYAADIGAGDPVTATLSATPPMRPIREEGFFLAQLYCDGSTPDNCGMVCPPSPATQQCLVKSMVTNFEYGVDGYVRIKASSSLKGPFRVTGSAVLPNAAAAISLSGDVK